MKDNFMGQTDSGIVHTFFLFMFLKKAYTSV